MQIANTVPEDWDWDYVAVKLGGGQIGKRKPWACYLQYRKLVPNPKDRRKISKFVVAFPHGTTKERVI